MKRVFLLTLCAAASINGIKANDSVDSEADSTIKRINLEEVVITATTASKKTPMAFSSVGKKELGKSNYGQDVPHLISLTPSITVTSDAGTGIGYTNFRVRGTDANRINITVDGVPVNDAESQTTFWVNMPDFSSSLENVQIQRGVGTSTNGSAAFGATVAMQTQKYDTVQYIDINSAAGSFSTFKNTFRIGSGLINNRFIFDARYSKITSDGFIDRSRADMQSYYASGVYLGRKTLVKYQTFGSKEKTQQAWNGVPGYMIKAYQKKNTAGEVIDFEGNLYADGENRRFNSCGMYFENRAMKFHDNQTDNYRQNHHHLSVNQEINDLWRINLTLHYTNGKGYYEDYKANKNLIEYGLIPFADSTGNTVNTTDIVRRKWLSNDFYGAIYSANYENERTKLNIGGGINNYECDHWGNVIWAKNYNNLSVDHKYYQSNSRKTDYNVFTKLNYDLNEYFNAFMDLQYRGIVYKSSGTDDKMIEVNNIYVFSPVKIDKDYKFFNPKAGISFNKENHLAFASFAISHREPSRDNFTEVGVNEQPTYEKLDDYEIGYKYAEKDFHLGMNLYYMNYSDQLILNGKISEIGVPLTTNIRSSYRAGIELSGGVKIMQNLEWNANATFSRNRIKGYTQVLENWDDGGQVEKYLGNTAISFSPNIIAHSILSLNINKFNAVLNSSYVSRQYLDNSQNKERSINPYFINSVIFGYDFKPKFAKELSVRLFVNNIFNTKYETNGWAYTALTGGETYCETGYFTQAGINFMGSVAIKF